MKDKQQPPRKKIGRPTGKTIRKVFVAFKDENDQLVGGLSTCHM